MTFADITSFIAELERRKDLVRIDDALSPDLEISAVIDRACKSPGGGPALVFERPTGATMPVAANLFGSMSRICLALGVETLDDLAREIEELTTPPQPRGFMDALKLMPLVSRLSDLMPKTVKDAPCQEIVKPDGGLDELPVLKTWPEDGGPFITLPLVITRDPETGMRNIGTYRMQVYDRRTTGMHWQRHKGGAQHHRVAERLGKRLDVAVALGADPVLHYAATAPMPEGLDELMLAGVIGKRRVELVKCRTVDLEVPASAQIVLEGYVEPGERRQRRPVRGSHRPVLAGRRFSGLPPDLRDDAQEADLLTTVVGRPPMEDLYIGKASERLFLPLIRKTLPEIVDMHFPAAGIFHNIVLVSIDKRYPGHARKIMSAFWGLGQLMFSKCIVVVDKDVNVQDEAEVAWVAGTHVDPSRDIQITTGPVDDLDDAAILPAFGGKMGIDATKKWPSEGVTREFPTKLVMTDAAAKRATAVWDKIKRGRP